MIRHQEIPTTGILKETILQKAEAQLMAQLTAETKIKMTSAKLTLMKERQIIDPREDTNKKSFKVAMLLIKAGRRKTPLGSSKKSLPTRTIGPSNKHKWNKERKRTKVENLKINNNYQAFLWRMPIQYSVRTSPKNIKTCITKALTKSRLAWQRVSLSRSRTNSRGTPGSKKRLWLRVTSMLLEET